MVYPFTLESHILTIESSRRSTFAAHAAKHEALLRTRQEEHDRRRREALNRIAPGFDPSKGALVPEKRMSLVGSVNPVSSSLGGSPSPGAAVASGSGQEHTRTRSVMDDLVDQLAMLDANSKK
jgi:hypothetical protein